MPLCFGELYFVEFGSSISPFPYFIFLRVDVSLIFALYFMKSVSFFYNQCFSDLFEIILSFLLVYFFAPQ